MPAGPGCAPPPKPGGHGRPAERIADHADRPKLRMVAGGGCPGNPRARRLRNPRFTGGEEEYRRNGIKNFCIIRLTSCRGRVMVVVQKNPITRHSKRNAARKGSPEMTRTKNQTGKPAAATSAAL